MGWGWRQRAKCDGLWWLFNAAADRAWPKATRQAIKVCEGCEVRETCLRENLDERYGVWGGTTPNVRTRLRKQAAKAVDSNVSGERPRQDRRSA